MPQISYFYGIPIWLNYNDHMPPHFRAWYGEYRAGVVKGEMPGRALRIILEWLDIHRNELIEDWQLAQNGANLKRWNH